MSLVTGSLLGKLERQWSMTGLTPFRYWYPKKLSSHQCSVTYSVVKVLWHQKMFLMSSSFFQEPLRSSRPRIFMPRDLRDRRW